MLQPVYRRKRTTDSVLSEYARWRWNPLCCSTCARNERSHSTASSFYEGRQFGVPFSYRGSAARIDDIIYIYSSDLEQQLTTHEVTWSKRDRYCADQYATLEQPEEFQTMPVKVTIERLPEPDPSLSFEKFNFDREVNWDE